MPEILAVCVSLAVLAGGGAVVVRAFGLIKKGNDLLDDWRGEPARDGVPERPGVMRRLAFIEGRVVAIEEQLKPNGGSTARDAVDRVERSAQRIEASLTAEHILTAGDRED